jgi:hypothetical protein
MISSNVTKELRRADDSLRDSDGKAQATAMACCPQRKCSGTGLKSPDLLQMDAWTRRTLVLAVVSLDRSRP